jgi:hypothetical protein
MGKRIPTLMLFAREFVQCEFWKTFGMFKVLISVLKETFGSILNSPDPFEKEKRRRRRRRHLLHKLPQNMRKSSYPHGAMLY